MKIINDLKTVYTMKGVGAPEYFLDGNIEELGPEWAKEGIKKLHYQQGHTTRTSLRMLKCAVLGISSHRNPQWQKNITQKRTLLLYWMKGGYQNWNCQLDYHIR